MKNHKILKILGFCLPEVKKNVFLPFEINELPKKCHPVRDYSNQFEIEKYEIGKLRFRAFQRLKNQRLATLPSKVMAISKFYKVREIHWTSINIVK